jgi:hypothetical protein
MSGGGAGRRAMTSRVAYIERDRDRGEQLLGCEA